MTIAYWCVLIAGLLPYIAVGIAKWGRGFDNNNPRDWLARQEGKKKRAHAAHLNSFEAFPLFAAGVIIASVLKASGGLVDALALTFVIARVIYIWCYVADRATLRSVVWFVGVGATVGLFVAATVAR